MNRETLFVQKQKKRLRKWGNKTSKISMLFPFGKIILKTTPDVLLLQ